MKKIRCILIFLILFVNVSLQAERYYVWAPSGLNVRESPQKDGKIIGRLDFGEFIEKDFLDIEVESDDPYKISEIGIKSQIIPEEDGKKVKKPAIKIIGNFVEILYKGKKGFVFSGYLSRLPTFKVIEKSKDHTIFESEIEYLKRVFDSKNNFKLDSINNGNYTPYGENFGSRIYYVTDNNGKGIHYHLCFYDFTINEILLFSLATLDAFGIDNPEFYGIEQSEENIIYFWPAPLGSVSIKKFGQLIVMEVWGSC